MNLYLPLTNTMTDPAQESQIFMGNRISTIAFLTSTEAITPTFFDSLP